MSQLEKKEKILLIGGDSFIAQAYQYYCQQQGVSLFTTSRRNKLDNWYLDLSDEASFATFIDKIKLAEIKTVLLCAGITNNQACTENPTLSHLINVKNTNKLLSLLNQLAIFTVYLSSSQVFDHKTAFIQWDSDYAPTTLYGQQKVAVEQYIQLHQLNVAIVRFTKVIGENFPLFTNIIEQAKQQQPITLFDDYCAAPISLSYVCQYLFAVSQLQKKGIYQLSGDEDLSYADMAKQLLNHLQLDGQIITQSAQAKGVSPTPYGSLANFSQRQLAYNNQPFADVLSSTYEPHDIEGKSNACN